MTARRALFLDKDGVINVDYGYVCTPERTDFIDGIFELCAAATQHGWLVVVVTNQAGIARGLYGEPQFAEYVTWLRAQFTAHASRLDAVYYCPHHPVYGLGDYLKECECRKPKPGMFLTAQREWRLDMPSSLLLGDSNSDSEAGLAAGIGTCLTVLTAPREGSGRTAFDPGFVRSVLTSLCA